MGVCCIPSLALIRGSSFSPMARHGIRSRDRERARVHLNKIFARFNFRRCARATKIKQREKLKGEVYLTRKFPDLRYIVIDYVEPMHSFTVICSFKFVVHSSSSLRVPRSRLHPCRAVLGDRPSPARAQHNIRIFHLDIRSIR